jgi:hypothetical protein
MKIIIKNVNDLNHNCGPTYDVGRAVESGNNVRKFHERKIINLVFYLDGLCLNDGPFRPYHWPAAQAVVQDLVDGYFPYEFKQNHPDGVPLKVFDKSTELCPKPSNKCTQDGGGGSGGGGCARNSINNVETLMDDKSGYKVISKSTFLQKLPKQVLRNGRLVEVRDEVASLLAGEKGGYSVHPVVLPTAALDERNKKGNDCPPATITASTTASSPNPLSHGIGREITTIQVKCQGASHEMCVFIVHLFYDQTISDLRAAIQPQLRERTGCDDKPFTLCTIYPSVTFSDFALTLEKAQLVPTATVHVRWL